MLFQVFVSLAALFASLTALWRAMGDHLKLTCRIRELEGEVSKAERVLCERGNLADELAHEIKNPITAILCSAEALDLLIGNSLDENHRKCLLYIREYGDNLLRLVSDFLDLSCLEGGRVLNNAEVVQVAPLVESIVGLLQPSAARKHIGLKSFVASRDLLAYVDPKHLKQVIFNLIHNAIQYTSPDGEIHVECKADFPHKYLRVSVKDNGLGIAPEKISAIFNPYVRGDRSEREHESGLGLGLAVCKSLVELSGGNIKVESQVGVGTCFEFTVPASYKPLNENNMAPLVLSNEAKPLLGQKILIVNQDSGSRESVAELIRAWGGMVDQVSMAAEAVKAISGGKYDAVMLDDTSDGLFAHEAARVIREEAQNKNFSLIVAARNELDQKLAEESGADGCIAKPFNGKLLLESLLQSGKYFAH